MVRRETVIWSLPCGVMCWIETNYVFCELQNAFTVLLRFHNGTKVVSSILVCQESAQKML